MANTILQRTLLGQGNDHTIMRLINIISDGSEETDLIIYDNSTFINNVNAGSIVKVQSSGSDCILRLEWDQTTDSHALSVNPSNPVDLDLRQFGGISNPAGVGATGDILLSTSSLDAGDEVTLIIWIDQA